MSNPLETTPDGVAGQPHQGKVRLFDRLSLMIIGGFVLVTIVLTVMMLPGYRHGRDSMLSDRYLVQRDYDHAVPYLESIVNRYPGAWMRRKMLGDSYLLRKNNPDPKLALEAYQKVLQDPGYQGFMAGTGASDQEKLDWDLNEEMGICYIQLGDEKKAQEYLAKALAKESDTPAANFYMGLQYFNSGNYRQAAQYFQNAATGDHEIVPEYNATEAPRMGSTWGDHWDKMAEPYRRKIAEKVLGPAPATSPAGGNKG